MIPITNLPQERVIREVFDAESQSLRVKFPNQSMSINLSKEDGDSVISHSNVIQASAEANEVVNILGTKQVSIYAPSGSNVSYSPLNEGDYFIPGVVGTIQICAARVKCDQQYHVLAV
jgi:hypothetical protein